MLPWVNKQWSVMLLWLLKDKTKYLAAAIVESCMQASRTLCVTFPSNINCRKISAQTFINKRAWTCYFSRICAGKSSLRRRLMGEGWCEAHEALSVTAAVKCSRFSWSYSVAQGKQLLPLTQTHTDLLRSPGNGTASEQASVTHSSKNKPGSCENKAWEPWNLGVVKGVGPLVCRAEGTFTGLPLLGKGTQSDKGWEDGSRLRAAHKVRSREHCVPASPAVFPITNPGHRGYSQPETDHIRSL